MTYLHRRIFKSQVTGAETLRELVQTMFVAEILHAKDTIWIVSPWITNISLIDNRSGGFDFLNPEWGRREIRVSEVLVSLMARGANVQVVTRQIQTNENFINAVVEEARVQALQDKLRVIMRDTLHSKGLLLTRSMLLGSMNLTYSGMQINDESIEFCISEEDVARTRLEFETYGQSPR